MIRRLFKRLAAVCLLVFAAAASHASTGILIVGGVAVFTTGPGTRISTFQIYTVSDTAQAVPGQQVRAQGCGSFLENGTSAIATSDAYGIATLPPWQAPYANGTCTLTFSLVSDSSVSLPVTINLVGPVAVGLQWLDPPPQQAVYGSTVSGMRLKVVDSAGNGVAGQILRPSAGCGSLSGIDSSNRYITSDNSGVVTIPAWTVPDVSGGFTACVVSVFLAGSLPPIALTAGTQFVAPPAATALQYLDSNRSFSVGTGYPLWPVSFATVDSSGNRMGNQAVTATATCGRFTNGASVIGVRSDSSGVVTLPTWTAPATAQSCTNTANLDLTPAAPISFGVDVFLAGRIELNGSRTSFDVPLGQMLSGIQVFTEDANGARMANQSMSANASCGSFAGGALGATMTSDANGVATMPDWQAPGDAASVGRVCNILFVRTGSASVNISINVTAGTAPPVSMMATSIAYGAASATSANVPVGAYLGYGSPMPFWIETRDSAGQPQAGLSFYLSSSCGGFPGGGPLLQSSPSMLPSFPLPPWQAPSSSGTCVIRAYSGSSAVEFTVNVIAPADTTSIAYVDDQRVFTVTAGQSLTGLRLATVNSSGTRLPNTPVALSTTCGTFSGGIVGESSSSDASGVIVFPTWFAPATSMMCSIQAYPFSNPASVGTLTVNVTAAMTGPTSPSGPSGPPTLVRSGTSPAGGVVSLSLAAGSGSCSIADLSVLNPAATDLFNFPPSSLAYAKDGYVDFRVDGCASAQSVAFTIEFPDVLPATAVWWKFGPTPDNRNNHWYPIPTTVDGRKISFTITDGGLGDDDLMVNGSIRDLGMLGIPGGTTQDLWWSGIAENGWGMSIIQHRDVLFANVFVYDAQGNPVWYVMPSGSWNAAHTAYTGNLYLPKGSPFYAYDVSRFDIGASVGNATLTFANPNEATFAYTINGITAQKNISRLAFGPVDAPLDQSFADLWWAGTAQNGWGIALLQQYSSLFALWFTYGADGKATWFVMPAGAWTNRGQYDGKLYRAQGPAWLGVPYDASRHHATEAGTFRLRFGADTATFDYTVDGRSGSIPLSRIPF